MRAALCDSCNWLPTGLQRVPLSFIRADIGAKESGISSWLSCSPVAAAGQGPSFAPEGELKGEGWKGRRGGYVKITRAMRGLRVRER